MRQVKGAEKVLYGLDDVKTAGEIIIVEGEMDKLALEEAGMTNVLSVPDGAPREVKAGDVPPPDADPKFAYLWNCRAVLDQAVRIVLATDSDAPGQARTVAVLATFLSQTMLHAGPCNATCPAPAACLPGP